MTRYMPFLLVIAVWIYAFVDCLGTPERQVRGLPKVVWLLIVLFFGEIMLGPLAWLAFGKRRVAGQWGAGRVEWGREPARGMRAAGRHPQDGRPLEAPQEDREDWVPPDDNPAFLRSLAELNRQKRGDGPGSSPESE
ncbi:Phospholipase_D-nuclease N-terminal [Actinacidiphila yanglinensis]|uniref:Phospholipase_D-nuclease N-terminal n=1 Tax=Actinacidiphila yanglinensis TaxID=310779 RepID=A0A1H6BXX3_9ACTN|nr:PLD nuclease N-terminal domain-containing protein [Actinacidiphila yanglinensis]SEG65502.1 Phospholipase_D-nuclease N-terminal [Actinacidiphila yanglinensis]